MSKRNIFILIVAFILALSCILISVLTLRYNEQYTSTALLNVKEKNDAPVCVLILGKDKTSGLFDVIMLVSFDEKNDSACVLQIPRDTYAEYTHKSYKKINAAPKVLGEKAFCDFLEQSLCVKIQGYISFELDAFSKAVDLIGGVEMTLPRALEYRDPEQGLYIHLPKGTQVLDGEKAQMLVRFRKGYIRGDLDRLDVQKRFMAAFFNKVKSSVNILNAYGIVSELFPYIKTDMSAPSLLSLGLNALAVKGDSVGFLTLPGEDARDGGSGASYYIMSAISARETLEKYFGKESGEIDVNSLFLNENSKVFTDIYNKRYEYSIMFADDLQ